MFGAIAGGLVSNLVGDFLGGKGDSPSANISGCGGLTDILFGGGKGGGFIQKLLDLFGMSGGEQNKGGAEGLPGAILGGLQSAISSFK